jgi:hypothetical protein
LAEETSFHGARDQVYGAVVSPDEVNLPILSAIRPAKGDLLYDDDCKENNAKHIERQTP